MTVWCVENLHRLPCEIHAPSSRLIAAMVAHGVVNAERKTQMEEEFARARRQAQWDS